MAYDINWFRNNVHAEIAPGLGGCSFCCFRNLGRAQYCDKLVCFDECTDNYVYWESKYGYDMLRGAPPVEMVEWFDRTPYEDIAHISGNMACIKVRRAILKNR